MVRVNKKSLISAKQKRISLYEKLSLVTYVF